MNVEASRERETRIGDQFGSESMNQEGFNTLETETIKRELASEAPTEALAEFDINRGCDVEYTVDLDLNSNDVTLETTVEFNNSMDDSLLNSSLDSTATLVFSRELNQSPEDNNNLHSLEIHTELQVSRSSSTVVKEIEVIDISDDTDSGTVEDVSKVKRRLSRKDYKLKDSRLNRDKRAKRSFSAVSQDKASKRKVKRSDVNEEQLTEIGDYVPETKAIKRTKINGSGAKKKPHISPKVSLGSKTHAEHSCRNRYKMGLTEDDVKETAGCMKREVKAESTVCHEAELSSDDDFDLPPSMYSFFREKNSSREEHQTKMEHNYAIRQPQKSHFMVYSSQIAPTRRKSSSTADRVKKEVERPKSRFFNWPEMSDDDDFEPSPRQKSIFQRKSETASNEGKSSCESRRSKVKRRLRFGDEEEEDAESWMNRISFEKRKSRKKNASYKHPQEAELLFLEKRDNNNDDDDSNDEKGLWYL